MWQCGKTEQIREGKRESDTYKEVNKMENIAGHHLFKIFCK